MISEAVAPKNFIRLQNISKTYDTTVVLDIEDETIPLDEIVAIVGYSGSGKSTLLNIISLLDVPDGIHCRTGKFPRLTLNLNNVCVEITYTKRSSWLFFEKVKYDFDVIISENGKQRKSTATEVRAEYFGYVFQESLLHPNFNLLDNIKTPLIICGTMIDDGLQEIIKSSELDTHTAKYANEISGGQQQRAAILRSLVKNSPIIVGDELTSNLDQDHAEQLLNLFQRSVKQSGKSFLWVTHNIHLAEKFADKIVTIKNQRVSVEENPKNVDRIFGLLHNNSGNLLEKIPVLGEQQRDSRWYEKIRYYSAYALRDLFDKFKPRADFVINWLSISLVLLFLLSMHKIGYGTDQFLEMKLSDPRINNFKITPSSTCADNMLTVKDVSLITERVGAENLRHISPVYKASVSLVRESDQKRFPLSKAAITFDDGDKIINNLFKETIDKYPFINDSENYSGIILYKGAIERYLPKLGLSEIPSSLTITVNTVTRKIPVLITDSPLPSNRHAMIRSEFYLEAYHDGIYEQNPVIAYILAYPMNIHNTIPMMDILTQHQDCSEKEYQVASALNIRKKIEVISEIERLMGDVVLLSLIAILLLSVAFVILTIYRSLNRKRKEIGVFLAFGMTKKSFIFFYLIEACLLWTTVVVPSIYLFEHQVNPRINEMIMSSEHIGNMGRISEQYPTIVVDPAMLDLPNSVLMGYYGGSLILLIGLFIFLIWYTTRRLPVALIKDS